MYDYNHGVTMIPPDEVKTGGVTDQMAFQWRQLQRLQVGTRQLKCLAASACVRLPGVHSMSAATACT